MDSILFIYILILLYGPIKSKCHFFQIKKVPKSASIERISYWVNYFTELLGTLFISKKWHFDLIGPYNTPISIKCVLIHVTMLMWQKMTLGYDVDGAENDSVLLI